MKCLVFFVLIAASVFAGDDEKPIVRAAKATDSGYSLFSWQEVGKEEWHFALLPAQSVEKLLTAEEITKKENTIDGLDALKKKLSALAINEKVGWYNMLEKKNVPEHLRFDFPSRDVVKELELYCTVLKIRLNIYRSK